jgi:hypothetical protein
MITGIDRQPQGRRKTYSAQINTYSKGPASYLCSWTGIPRAEAGGPGVSGMPLVVTARTAVRNFSRQVGFWCRNL